MPGEKFFATMGLALILTTTIAAPVRAQAIIVPNGSFESPSTTFAQPSADSWTTTGGQNTGIFLNLPQDMLIDVGGGFTVLAKRITNADGNQLAFIGAGNSGTANEFSQVLQGASYTPGNSYNLSVGVAISSVQPPDVGSRLLLELYYLDDLNNRHSVASMDVTNDASTGLRNDQLTYFNVPVPTVSPGAAFANRNIGILLTTLENGPTTGGTFDIDDVTLTPEPGAATLLILGVGAGLLRRRASH